MLWRDSVMHRLPPFRRVPGAAYLRGQKHTRLHADFHVNGFKRAYARIYQAGDFFEFLPVRIIRKKPVDHAAQRALGPLPVSAQIRRTAAAMQKKFSNLLHIRSCEDCFCEIHKNLHLLIAR